MPRPAWSMSALNYSTGHQTNIHWLATYTHSKVLCVVHLHTSLQPDECYAASDLASFPAIHSSPALITCSIVWGEAPPCADIAAIDAGKVKDWNSLWDCVGDMAQFWFRVESNSGANVSDQSSTCNQTAIDEGMLSVSSLLCISCVFHIVDENAAVGDV